MSVPLPTYKRFRNLAGIKFGKLTAKEYLGSKDARGAFWLCVCDCGKRRNARAVDLLSGNTQSCGCIKSAQLVKRNTTHGLSSRPEYRTWVHIVQRCTNPKAPHFESYGGRGITVCDRWKESFENFYADVGPRPSARHEIDRKDNNGNYEPGNVRWTTKKSNGRNKRNNHVLAFNGKSLCIAEWSEHTGIPARVIQERISSGWTIERALTERPKKQRSRAS